MISLPCDSNENAVLSEQTTTICSVYNENGKTYSELFEDIAKIIIAKIATEEWQEWR